VHLEVVGIAVTRSSPWRGIGLAFRLQQETRRMPTDSTRVLVIDDEAV
jgi:hypothetical protein